MAQSSLPVGRRAPRRRSAPALAVAIRLAGALVMAAVSGVALVRIVRRA